MTDIASGPDARPVLPMQARVDPLPTAERWYSDTRISGLTRFAFSITLLNVAGHLFLGFEQPWITPFVSLAAAYSTEIVGETSDAFAAKRRPHYLGSWSNLIKFLLSAHITGLAVGMLLYACDQLAPIAFASSLAIASKYVLRVRVTSSPAGTTRHFLNPSNFGISATLLLFPLVSIAPPYQFTENTSGAVDWLLPLLVIIAGTLLNLKATGRIPLILAWLAAFAAQAALRSATYGTPFVAALLPMSGFAFILFTFYMITDPATTPTRPRNQVVFAVAVATVYCAFVQMHVVFGLFYALTVVTAVRGSLMFVVAGRVSTRTEQPRSAESGVSLTPAAADADG